MNNPRRQTRPLCDLLDIDRLKNALSPGSKLLVAVSGGADSVALLLALHAVRHQAKIHLQVVHINHGLRSESDAEEAFVQDLCGQIAVPCHVRRVDAGSGCNRHGSAEAHWRQLRYDAFRDILETAGANALALGHTANDLAETFLFHLARGTGIDGLTFRYESFSAGLRVLRPLWHTRREDIELALREAGVTWVDDPSNQDQRHSRNLLRHSVIPELEKINPDAINAIMRASQAISQVNSQENSTIRAQGALAMGTPDYGSRGGRIPLEHLLPENGAIDGCASRLQTFLRSLSQSASSRQLNQAATMICRDRVGTIALTGGKTLVITQTDAWLSDQQQPGARELALEHSRRFGGFYAELPEPIPVDRHHHAAVEKPVVLTDILNRQWQFSAPGDSMFPLQLMNRSHVNPAAVPALKKQLNAAKLPWYLRDFTIVAVRAKNAKISGLLQAADSTGQQRCLTLRRMRDAESF